MKIVTCAPVDCSLADPSGAVAVDWSSQKSDEDSSERGRECRDRWPVGLRNTSLIKADNYKILVHFKLLT